MLDASMVLDRLQIRRNSAVQGCQDVGNMIREATDPCFAAHKLFMDVLGVNLRFDDEVYARVCAKAMINEVISAGCLVDDPSLFVEEGKEYATNFCSDPKWAFLWAKSENEFTQPAKVENIVQVSQEVELKVAVRSDGSIKKGGKAQIAEELFRTKVLEAEVPLTSKEFITLLMSEAQLTAAGASTYRYNLWKKYDWGKQEKK